MLASTGNYDCYYRAKRAVTAFWFYSAVSNGYCSNVEIAWTSTRQDSLSLIDDLLRIKIPVIPATPTNNNASPRA